MEDFNKNPNEYRPNDPASENITSEPVNNASENINTENPFAGMPQQNDFYTEGSYISPVYVTKKRGVNPLAIILPIAAAVIAAVAVFVVLMLNRPSSYREAEKQFFSTLFTAAGETEELVADSLGSEKLTVDFSTPLGDLSGIDLSQYKLEINTAGNDNAVYALITAMLGEETNLNAEMWIDRQGGKSYMFFPEISDIYAVVDTAKAFEESKDYSRYSDSLNRVIEKTSEVYFEVVGDPQTERNAQFTVNGNTFTADKATVHLDIRQLAIICKAFLENMAENSETAEMLCQIGEFDSPQEMREEIEDVIAEMQKSIDGEDNSNAAFDMTVYMQNNTIVGREIVISNYDNSETVYVDLYQIPLNDGETGYFSFFDNTGDRYDLSKLTFAYEDKKNGELHSGNADFNISLGSDTVTLKANYTDVSAMNDSFGGDINLTLGGVNEMITGTAAGQSDTYSVNIRLSKDADKKIVNVTVPNICTVNFTMESSDLQFKAVPSPASDKMAVINSDSDEYYDAFEQLMEDFSNYLFPDYNDYYNDEFIEDFSEYYDYENHKDPYESSPEINAPAKINQPIADSGVLGSWRPVKMIINDVEYDLNGEDFVDMSSIVYTFSADGTLLVSNEAEGIDEAYTFYFDSYEENHILLEDDIYSSIYYDEANDVVTVGDDSGIAVIWFERV